MRFDFRYVEIDRELSALAYMLDVIEPAIVRSAEDGEARVLAKLRASGWEHDDTERQFAWQDIQDIQDYVLPRFMRGPFVVALWACFEASVRAVARTMEAEAQSATALDEVHRPMFPLRACSHFQAQFDMALDPDGVRFERLKDLYTLRNGLAHTNGLREGMGTREWTQFEGALQRGGVDSGPSPMAVVLTRGYVEQSYSDVAGSVRSLVDRARTHQTHRR